MHNSSVSTANARVLSLKPSTKAISMVKSQLLLKNLLPDYTAFCGLSRAKPNEYFDFSVLKCDMNLN